MSNKKKILIFTPSSVGGAQKVSLSIAKALYNADYEIIFVLISNQVEDIRRLIPECFETIHIRVRNIYDFATLKIYKVLKKERPYAVFTSFNYLWGRVAFASRLVDKNIKCIVRSNIGIEKWDGVTRKLAAISLKYIDKAVMQTEEMKSGFDILFPKYRNKFVVISNPIDAVSIEKCIANAQNPFDSNNVNFLSTCRIDPQKRLDDLIRAFACVKRKIDNARLTVLGNFNANRAYYEKLLQIIRDEGIETSVAFIGLQDNPYKFLKYADCFVLPSASEGYPNSLLEALYLGVPSVATRSVPVVDQILTPERGFVIDVGDVKKMSDTMIKALNLKVHHAFRQDTVNDFIELFDKNS